MSAVPLAGGQELVYVARQPILDRRQRLFGYELLYRDGPTACFQALGLSADHATLRLIGNSVGLLGLDDLTRGRRAFINFTRETLLGEYALLLPPTAVVVEILETVKPDAQVIAACRALKERGYVLALDDVTLGDAQHPLLDLVDIAKVDFAQAGPFERATLSALLQQRRLDLLAEKVETPQDVEAARRLGYHLFQGYYFSRPTLVQTRDPRPSELQVLRLLEIVQRPEVDFAAIERIVGQEVGLAYRLLRFINSAAFGLRHRIASLHQALRLLGHQGIRKWVTLAAVANSADSKPSELLVQAVLRARFCEELAQRGPLRDRASDLFLTGLFSLIDVVLERPLPEILAQLPLPEAVNEALLRGDGPLGPPLQLVLAYERADWEGVAALGTSQGLTDEAPAEAYTSALAWLRAAGV